MTRERRLSRVRAAIDRGADAAEEIHRKAVELPLGMLEHVELLEGAVKEARRVSDRSIGAIYDFVRDVNHEVVRLTEDLLEPPKAAAGHRPLRKRPRVRAA